jgi:transcriptional regulator with XRE-family HTH domain
MDNLEPLEPREITPEMVETEARRFALRAAGQLLLAMADKGMTEEDLAKELEVSIRTLRHYLRGQNWRGYMPLMAICLAIGVRMEIKLMPD